ncbi:MAG: DUF6324 family protein [Alphaproteobacteria bacterium]
MPKHDSDLEAELMIGPTELGMVRLLIVTPNGDIPMDFDPDEAEEIARELQSAANQVRKK